MQKSPVGYPCDRFHQDANADDAAMKIFIEKQTMYEYGEVSIA